MGAGEIDSSLQLRQGQQSISVSTGKGVKEGVTITKTLLKREETDLGNDGSFPPDGASRDWQIVLWVLLCLPHRIKSGWEVVDFLIPDCHVHEALVMVVVVVGLGSVNWQGQVVGP